MTKIVLVVGLSPPSAKEQLTFKSSPGRCEQNVVEPPPSQLAAITHPIFIM